MNAKAELSVDNYNYSRNGINMSNIATLFKISNIGISGGYSTNRASVK